MTDSRTFDEHSLLLKLTFGLMETYCEHGWAPFAFDSFLTQSLGYIAWTRYDHSFSDIIYHQLDRQDSARQQPCVACPYSPHFTMGYSLSWMAVRGKSAQAILNELSFCMTDKREEIPESDLTAVEMPNGWYIIVSNHDPQVVSDVAMRRLASSGCEIVTCFVEEHVMVSSATGWKDGLLRWSVTHDAQEGLLHLEIEGEPPPEFAAIRDRMFAEQATGDQDCDYIFDVPVETARSITGYRYDEDIPGLSGEVFEVLAPLPDERPFLRRLFEGWFRTPRNPPHR